MESLPEPSLNDVEKCNQDCTEVGKIFPDSTVCHPAEVPSNLLPCELKLSDKTNGILCKLVNSGDPANELFNENDNYIAGSQPIIDNGQMEPLETQEATASHDEQSCVVSHSAPPEATPVKKDEGLIMNNIDVENNLIELSSCPPLQDKDNTISLCMKSNKNDLYSSLGESIPDAINIPSTVESHTSEENASENCKSTLVLSANFLDGTQDEIVTVDVTYSGTRGKSATADVTPTNKEDILEGNFIFSQSNTEKTDDLFNDSLSNSTSLLVENCIPHESHLTNLEVLGEENCAKNAETQCCMQHVVGGILQPLQIRPLESDGCKDDSLFVGVLHDARLDDDKISFSLPNSDVLLANYEEDNVELTDLTESLPVQLEHEKQPQLEEDNSVQEDIYKAVDIEEKKVVENETSEGKPLLLKIMPIKNGHGLWNIEELRFLLEDSGSVLLRLCAAPEAGNEDIIEGPQADFTALLLEDTFHIPESKVKSNLTNDLGALPPSLVEKLTETTFQQFSHLLKESRGQSTPKKKAHPAPFTPFIFGPQPILGGPPRGRRRGRPPLHNRPWISKSWLTTPTSKRFLNEPIKYRPPTPPTSHLGGERRPPLGFLEGSPGSGGAEVDPRINCASLSSVKRPAPGSLLSRRLMLARREDSAGTLAPLPRPTSVPCPYCPLRFAKKAAQVAHVKLRHSQLRQCPLCRARVQARGKGGLALHMAQAHPQEDGFRCEECGEAFRLLHHLRNHWRLAHERAGGAPTATPPASPQPDQKEEKGGVQKEGETSPPPAPPSPKKRKIPCPKEEEDPGPPPRKKVKGVPQSVLSATTLGGKPHKSKQQMKLRSAVVVMDSSFGGARLAAKGLLARTGHSVEEGSGSSGSIELDLNDSAVLEQEEEKRRYFCDKCDLGFSHVFKLRHHKKKHLKVPSPTAPKAAPGPEESAPQGGAPLRCGVCGKESRNEHQFHLHVARHGDAFQTPPKVGSGRTRVSTEAVHPPKGKGGPISGKKGVHPRPDKMKPSSPASSQEDGEVDEGRPEERPPYIVRKGRGFECVKCQVGFKREKQMVYHLKKIHETLYPFRRCPHCERIFRSSGPFMRHVREHSQRHCPVDGCRAKYKVLRLIKKHQRHAHPDLPHRCLRCVALFALEDDLDAHIEEEHRVGPGGERHGLIEEEEVVEIKELEKKKKKKKVKKEAVKNHHHQGPRKRKVESEEMEEDEGPVSPSGRRACATNVSYREDEDDDEVRGLRPPTKIPRRPPSTPKKRTPPPSPPPRLPEPPPQPNPLKNLREALKIKTKKPPVTPPQVPRPKRRYVRRAPYRKRKLGDSWTAALKAQQGVTGAPPPYGITADVVRRVAESLLSRHQQGHHPQAINKRRTGGGALADTLLGYTAPGRGTNSSRLPRITYSTLAAVAASRESSRSSFDDSSDPFGPSGRGGALPFRTGLGPFAPGYQVPDDEEGGDEEPSKVLRFDNF